MATEIKRETCFCMGFKRIMNLASELGTQKKKKILKEYIIACMRT